MCYACEVDGNAQRAGRRTCNVRKRVSIHGRMVQEKADIPGESILRLLESDWADFEAGAMAEGGLGPMGFGDGMGWAWRERGDWSEDGKVR